MKSAAKPELTLISTGLSAPRKSKIRDFDEHLVQLHSVIAACDAEQLLAAENGNDGDWRGVCYALQMAASVQEVTADTTKVDTTGSWSFCRASAEFDASHSAVASRYMKRLVVFNFLWAAYENARAISAFGTTLTSRSPTKTRDLSRLTNGLSDNLALFSDELREAGYACHRGGGLDKDLIKIHRNADNSIAERSADLVRHFRHHIFHGDDTIPLPDDPECGPGLTRTSAVLKRFSSVSRLILMLIQLMAMTSLTDHELSFADINGLNHDDDIDATDGKYTLIELLSYLHLAEEKIYATTKGSS
jgi:hypothetical protein